MLDFDLYGGAHSLKFVSDQPTEKDVKEKISELDKELDFVLITEHFQSSLVLLAQKFCLDIRPVSYTHLTLPTIYSV